MQTNPIVKKFNEVSLNYMLSPLNGETTRFYLTDKQGNFPTKLSTGSYGYKVFDVYPVVESELTKCFGKVLPLSRTFLI